MLSRSQCVSKQNQENYSQSTQADILNLYMAVSLAFLLSRCTNTK